MHKVWQRLVVLALVQLACALAFGWSALALGAARAGMGDARSWWLGGAWAGFAFATWLLQLVDARRAGVVLGWLRRDAAESGRPHSATAPALPGAWGEAATRMRRRLREAEQRQQSADARLHEILSALQASPNGVVLLERDMRIEWCNQTAAEHLGIHAERDLLQSIGNLVRDPAFARYCASGSYAGGVVIAGRHSTPTHPVQVQVQLHPYGEGRMLLLSRDVTALEQAEAMRRDFVANVSHEIRTPLTVLTGFVETLQTLPLDEAERRHYLGLMAQQAARMQSVVQDLLTLSRLEGSPAPGLQARMPIASLVAQCRHEAHALSAALGRGHTLEFPDDATLDVALAGSAVELQSALSNLVSNAVRYTPAGGAVRVRWTVLDGSDPARGAAGEGEFAVQDTGPGIAPEHVPRLTERFYRIDRSRSRDSGGTGLGLAIVKHVMQRHGGRLRITTRPGAGSTFALVFPAERVLPPDGSPN